MYKVTDMLLTPNKYSRPQTKLKSVKGIVVHWVANPKSTAKANRNFFENRKSGTSGSGSAHYVIDLDGTVIRCLPENEVAYHVGTSQPISYGSTQIYTTAAWQRLNSNSNKNVKPYPNDCTIGIECTHLDATGKMSDATYNTLVEMCADLCKKYKLNPLNDLWLHKEVVGWKDCHKWFVDNPNEWKNFKIKVDAIVNPKAPVVKTPVTTPAPVVKPSTPAANPEQWKIDLGKQAALVLQKEGIISDAKTWEDKMLEPAEDWLLFELVNRILNKK